MSGKVMRNQPSTRMVKGKGKPDDKWIKWVKQVCIFAPPFFFLLGGLLFFVSVRVPFSGNGLVAGRWVGSEECGNKCVRYIFAFTTENGQAIQVEDSSFLPLFSISQERIVQYKLAEPTTAIILPPEARWYYPLANLWCALAWLATAFGLHQYKYYRQARWKV